MDHCSASHVEIKSDINYRIARLFRDRSIKMPYPIQEFLLKGINLPRELEPSLLRESEDLERVRR